MPRFLHCGWVTRPGLLSHISDLHLDGEKGPMFQPVRLILTDLALLRYSLQALFCNLGHWLFIAMAIPSVFILA